MRSATMAGTSLLGCVWQQRFWVLCILLLGRGGGTKSMMVALFFTLVLGLVLAKDRKAYGEEMLAGLRESMFCVICVAFFMGRSAVLPAENQRPDPGADLGGG